MTIAQALKLAAKKLSAREINLPHLEAEILLSEIIKKPREFLITHDEFKLSARQIMKFKSKISRRLKAEPIAYLTGHKEFYGLDFKVNKNVLIPRPETESMVEEAIKLVTRSSQPVALVDVGTGSGCIAITLARLTKQKLIAIDISKKALRVARKNAISNNVNKNIKFIKGNLLLPILNSKFLIRNSRLIIIANLPYLTPAQIKNSPSIKYEPKLALSAGPDGLKYYRQLFKQIKSLSAADYALCEFDPRQTSKIKQLIKRELPETSCQIKKDLSGLNRLAIIEII
ncbi:MAG: peptide chain release factor N(5)-glutamine methyltransferase [Patescibacteria group bacterium]|nr:peptide chain release factor N(5)-glutamine methyltransferase [Patescibacteria group bacterium]